MTDTAPQIVTNYLTELDSALVGVPSEVRTEIVAGIREELDGLDATRAAQRIEELGDPAFIASEASAESVSPVADEPEPEAAPAPGRTFSILAVIVLIAGSFVVPVVGVLAGLVWVCFAKAWSRGEKIVMWLVPIAAVAVAIGIGVIASAATTDTVASTSPHLTGWHAVILLAYLIFPIEGIVLAVRAHRRGWRV